MNKQEILKYGLMVFNNETDKFERWFEKENVYLENYSPKELIEDEYGRIQVKQELDRIEYGIFN